LAGTGRIILPPSEIGAPIHFRAGVWGLAMMLGPSWNARGGAVGKEIAFPGATGRTIASASRTKLGLLMIMNEFSKPRTDPFLNEFSKPRTDPFQN
jgi:hypothetical protein